MRRLMTVYNLPIVAFIRQLLILNIIANLRVLVAKQGIHHLVVVVVGIAKQGIHKMISSSGIKLIY